MIPFTPSGYHQLEIEHKRLETERLATLERLKIAREQGDLSENGAYRYAKMELGNLSRQLRTITYLLKEGKITLPPLDNHTVSFGHTVALHSTLGNKTYLLVSQYESNPQLGKISMESPLGIHLLGKHLNDTFTLKAPAGDTTWEIVSISS